MSEKNFLPVISFMKGMIPSITPIMIAGFVNPKLGMR